MIKLRDFKEFTAILENYNKSIDTSIQEPYKKLSEIETNNIINIQYLPCIAYNLLLVTYSNTYEYGYYQYHETANYYGRSKKSTDDIYVGILTVDLLRMVNNICPEFLENNEGAFELIESKQKLDKISAYKVLGYFTNQNTLQITLKQKEDVVLPDDLSKTIILFPTATIDTIQSIMDNINNNKLETKFKNLTYMHLLSPLLKFTDAYNALQSISQIVPKDGLIEFDEPLCLIDILEHYHSGCKEIGLLGKLIKPNDKTDIVFDSMNTLSGQRNLNPAYFDKIHLSSWNDSTDFQLLKCMINEAHYIKRKAKSTKNPKHTNKINGETKDIEYLNRNHKSIKDMERVHKKKQLKNF